jgi:DHA2 family lincomycin resistance protein-like MFS transporter
MWALSTLNATTPLGVVIGMHLLLSVGIALMFTPLMTTALGSLTPARYPHGSATISTLQQVSGAAGIALFITLYTVGSATASSTDAPTALAGGVSTAFAIGAIISIAAIPVAALLRKPPKQDVLDEGQ